MAKFSYEIKQHIGTISATDSLTLELNLISYTKAPAKYDLRRWRVAEDGKQMNKGVTMTKDELVTLRDLLNSLELK